MMVSAGSSSGQITSINSISTHHQSKRLKNESYFAKDSPNSENYSAEIFIPSDCQKLQKIFPHIELKVTIHYNENLYSNLMKYWWSVTKTWIRLMLRFYSRLLSCTVAKSWLTVTPPLHQWAFQAVLSPRKTPLSFCQEEPLFPTNLSQLKTMSPRKEAEIKCWKIALKLINNNLIISILSKSVQSFSSSKLLLVLAALHLQWIAAWIK